MDTIYTMMVNFQDVLKQQGKPYGALWCDEGVYAIAKELQLLFPEKFKNIFLGLGGFHYEKIVYGCVGRYLEISGIDAVLTETECFGVDVVNSVLEGTNYVRSKEGLSMINEAIQSLMLDEFLKSIQLDMVNEKCAIDIIKALQKGEGAVLSMWETNKKSLQTFLSDLQNFRTTRAANSDNFKYWMLFTDELYSICRNLTLSLRAGDWKLYQ